MKTDLKICSEDFVFTIEDLAIKKIFVFMVSCVFCFMHLFIVIVFIYSICVFSFSFFS